MPEDFDPYRKWLGIAPNEQPPHHYRLLGIAPFEDDPDVIQNAADRQRSHIRTFQGGPNRVHSQRILNELSNASIVLLDPERKAAYDAELRQYLSGIQASPPAVEDFFPPLPTPPPPRRDGMAPPQPLAPPPRPLSEPAQVGPAYPPPAPPSHGPPPAPIDSLPLPVVSKSRAPVIARTKKRSKSTMVPMIIGLVAVGALLVGMLVFIVSQTNETEDTVVKKAPVPPVTEKNETTEKNTTEKNETETPGPDKSKNEKKKSETTGATNTKTKPDPNKPPETASQADKFKYAIAQARSHLTRRELEQAKVSVDNAEYLQMSAEDKSLARDMRQLYAHSDLFWNGVREGIYKKSKPGDVIAYKDDELELLGSEGEIVKYRFNDKPHEHSVLKLPTTVAVAFGQHGLDKNDPISLVAIGTFLALDGTMTIPARRELAKEYWMEAAQEGEKDVALAHELGLDDTFVASMSNKPEKPLDPTTPGTEPDLPPLTSYTPPTEEELRPAKEQFKARYGEQLAKARNKPEELQVLLDTLAADADKEKDSALKYLIHENACDMAADVARVDLILKLADAMNHFWGIDAMQQKLRLLNRCKLAMPMVAESVLAASDALLGEAESSQRLEMALNFSKLSLKAAEKIKGKDLKPLQAKNRELAAYLDASNKSLAGEETLAKDPTDPAANGNVGRFLCYFKRDFQGGLRHLAQGNIEDEKMLATDDLAEPTSGDQQAQLAERWYQLGKKKAGVARQSCFLRSQHWLIKAQPTVSDDMKATVEKLERELAKELASGAMT